MCESGEGSATAGQPRSADLQSRLHEAIAALPAELRALPIYEQGVAARLLLARADEGVDLLVMGSRGQGPLRSVVLARLRVRSSRRPRVR